METNLLLGFGFVLLGALCNGTFALPSKFVKNFSWENTWGAFFFMAMIVVPVMATVSIHHGLLASWEQAGWLNAGLPVLFGFLWGCGAILFGIGVNLIGLSLGYSIIMGLCSLLGSLLPLVTQHSEQVMTRSGMTIIAGILVCVGGVAVCGYAGILRGKSQSADQASSAPDAAKMVKGLIICILSGVFSACCNMAFSYGNPIKLLSESAFGNAPWIATLSVWMLVFIGGFMAAGSYTIYLLSKNSTWSKFTAPGTGRNLVLITIMAVLHFGALFLYGIGAHYLGKLGTSVGWAVNMSFGLIIANLMGFITAEWRNSSPLSRQWIAGGLTMLIAGIVVLGVGNSMQP